MKDIFIDKSMNFILKYNNYSIDEQERLKYGLTSIYLLITKLLVIIACSLILNIGKEVLIFLLIYNGIRLFSFGLHATKSWICLLSSTVIFIGIPFLSSTISINIVIKTIINVISIILLFKNSPADTYKRPIVNKNRRLTYRYLTVIISIIYSFLSIFTNNFMSNCFMFSLLVQDFITSPLIYKLFHLPYNNYKNYDV